MPDNSNYPALEMSLQQAHPRAGRTFLDRLPKAMTLSPPLDVFAPCQLHDQLFVHRGDGQEVEGVQAFDRGEARGPDPALHHALVAVDEFQFGKPEQVVGMVSALGGALGGQLAVLPLEGGQLQFLEVMLQEQR